MYSTENYYFDKKFKEKTWDSDSHTTIEIPIIVAKESYLRRISDAGKIFSLRNLKTRIETVKQELHDFSSRRPKIFRVFLHPKYDIIQTGGLLGTHYLTENRFSELPNLLEDFSDHYLEELLNILIVPAYELEEIRKLEKKLRENNLGYRLTK